jgi:cytoskeletal protein RodZ
MGLSRLGVTVNSMKKILALIVIIGLGVGGFMWWKRIQVVAANEINADPWPAAVAPVQAPSTDSPAEIPAPSVEPEEMKPKPKKSTAKKTTPAKATQEPG